MSVQRLLPLGQQLYNGWALINSASNSIWDALDVIVVTGDSNEELYRDIKALDFQKEISLQNLSFSYTENQTFISDVNLKIPKGSKVGIFGATGSGKSTFMDLLMGFIFPNEGAIYIDGKILNHANIREWQQNISHVPQKIYIQE